MEFQAVVMAAGKGSRIMEVTSTTPKCLLPVGNVPIIKSCLHMLNTFGINDIIVVVSEPDKSKVQESIESKCDVKVDIVSIPKNEDWGTADSLRYIKDKICKDVIIVSCDLVTNLNLQSMANMHRKSNSSLTILLTPWHKMLKDTVIPGHKGKHKQEKDIIGVDEKGKLVFFNSEADFDEGVPIKISTFNSCPVVHVHSNLMDAHVYIMKKFLVDYICFNSHISTLKGEFLPMIVRKQFSNKPDPILSLHSTVEGGSAKELQKLALKLSTQYLEKSIDKDKFKCFAYVDTECFCMRANTLVAFAKINQVVSKNFVSIMGSEKKPHQFPKSQVDNDSIIGEECELLTKSSVKQSVVGSHCVLNEKVKISGSIIMDNVTFGAGSVIQGCIICSNAQIGSQCDLKSCVVAPKQNIADMSKLSNDVLQGSFKFMEI